MVSSKELPKEALEEMQKNEGVVSPVCKSFYRLGQHQRGLYGICPGPISGKVAAGSPPGVNDGGYILFRTFLKGRNTGIRRLGFTNFRSSKKKLCLSRIKKALASVPSDNERSMRLTKLFFQGKQHHVSYEILQNIF